MTSADMVVATIVAVVLSLAGLAAVVAGPATTRSHRHRCAAAALLGVTIILGTLVVARLVPIAWVGIQASVAGAAAAVGHPIVATPRARAARFAARLGIRPRVAVGAAVAVVASSLVAVPLASAWSGPHMRVELVEPIPRAVTDAECEARRVGRAVAVAEADAELGRQEFVIVAHAPAIARAAHGSRPVVGVLPACDGSEAGHGSFHFADLATPSPAAVGATYASFLESRGNRSVAVVVDDTTRAAELARALARAMPRGHVVAVDVAHAAAGTGAVVIATGWTDARRAVRRLRAQRGAGARAVLLAPWLLIPDLFGLPSDWGTPQLNIGLPFDPTSEVAARYLAAVAEFAPPGTSPSGAGLAGYLDARIAMVAATHRVDPATPAGRATLERLAAASSRGDARPGVQLYTPADIQILPAGLNHDHTFRLSWFVAGGFSAVSNVIALPLASDEVRH